MTAFLVAVALAGSPSYPGCHTHACVERVQHRAHAQTLKRWHRVVRPFREWLRRTRMCESGGNYRTATNNGFWGAYQFTLSSWRAAGGHGYPHLAEPAEQDYRAVRLRGIQGRGAWPVCG